MIDDQAKLMSQAIGSFQAGLETMRRVTSPLEGMHKETERFYRRVRPQRMVRFFRDSMKLTDKMKKMDFSSDLSEDIKDLTDKISKSGRFGEDISDMFSEETMLSIKGDFAEFEGSAEEFVKFYGDKFIDEGIGKKSSEFLEEDLVEMLEEFREEFEEIEEERVEGWEEHEETAVDALKVVGDEAGNQADEMKSAFGGVFDWLEENIVGLATFSEVKGIAGTMAEEEEKMREQHIKTREMLGLSREEYMETFRIPLLDRIGEWREGYEGWRVQAELTEDAVTDAIDQMIQMGYMGDMDSLQEYGIRLTEISMLHEAAADVPYEAIVRSWDALDEEAGAAITNFSERLDYLSRASQVTWDIQEEGWQMFEQMEPHLRRAGLAGEEYTAVLEGLPPVLAAVAESGMDVGVAQEFLLDMFLRADPAGLAQQYLGADIEAVREAMRRGDYLPAMEALERIGQTFERAAREGNLELLLDQLGMSSELVQELVQQVEVEGSMAFQELIPHFHEMNELALDAEGATEDFIQNMKGFSPVIEQVKNYTIETAKQMPLIRNVMFEIEQYDLGLAEWTMLSILLPKIGASLKSISVFLGPKGWIVLGIIAGTTVIRDRWEDITEFMGDRFEGMTDRIGSGVDWLENRFGRLFGWVKRAGSRIAGIFDWIRSLWPFGRDDDYHREMYEEHYDYALEQDLVDPWPEGGWEWPEWPERLTVGYWRDKIEDWDISPADILTKDFWIGKEGILPSLGDWTWPKWLTLEHWQNKIKGWDISPADILTKDFWIGKEGILPSPGDWTLPRWLTKEFWIGEEGILPVGEWEAPRWLTTDFWVGEDGILPSPGDWERPDWLKSDTWKKWFKELRDREWEMPDVLSLDWWKKQFDKLRDREWKLPDPLTLSWWGGKFGSLVDSIRERFEGGEWEWPQPLTLDWWRSKFREIRDGEWSLPKPLTLTWWKGLFTGARKKMQGDDWLTWPQPLTIGWWSNKFGEFRNWIGTREWSLPSFLTLTWWRERFSGARKRLSGFDWASWPQPLTLGWWQTKFGELRSWIRAREWNLPQPLTLTWWQEQFEGIRTRLKEEEFEIELMGIKISKEAIEEDLEPGSIISDIVDSIQLERTDDGEGWILGRLSGWLELEDVEWTIADMRQIEAELINKTSERLERAHEEGRLSFGDPAGRGLGDAINLSVKSLDWAIDTGIDVGFGIGKALLDLSREDDAHAAMKELRLVIRNIVVTEIRNLSESVEEALEEETVDWLQEYGRYPTLTIPIVMTLEAIGSRLNIGERFMGMLETLDDLIGWGADFPDEFGYYERDFRSPGPGRGDPHEVGTIQAYQKGGIVPGYGGGDRVPALLERGEAVIPKESVREGISGILSFLGRSMDLGINFIFPDYQDLPDWFRTIINWSPILDLGEEEPLEPELEFRKLDKDKIRHFVGSAVGTLTGAVTGTSRPAAGSPDTDFDTMTGATLGTGVEDFVKSVKPAAKKVAEHLGITDWRMIAAQWGHESGWGKSQLSDYWNLAGIKAVGGRPAVDMATWEVYDGTRTDITAGFEVFEGLGDFATRFAEVLGLERYAVEGAEDIEEYASALLAGGYATDPAYINRLIGTYESVVKRFPDISTGDTGITDWFYDLIDPDISEEQGETLDRLFERSEEPFWGLKELGQRITNILPERKQAKVLIDDTNIVSAIDNNTRQVTKKLDRLIEIAEQSQTRRRRKRDEEKDSFVRDMRGRATQF